MARIPAHEIEQVVSKTIQKQLIGILELDEIEDYEIIRHITENRLLAENLVKASINRITVDQGELQVEVNSLKLRQYLEDQFNLLIPNGPKKKYIISTTFTTRRAHKGAIILKLENDEYDPFDLPPLQLRNLIRGIVWRDEPFDGMSMMDIAKCEDLSQVGIRKIIMASFDTLLVA